jgi:hypothetical protein
VLRKIEGNAMTKLQTLKQRKEELEIKIKNFDWENGNIETAESYADELSAVKYQIQLCECDYISVCGVPYYD